MKISHSPLEGVFYVKFTPVEDFRGSFSRSYCYEELKQVGLIKNIAQINHVVSHKKGTIRGLHYQISPRAEIKMMRCFYGALYNVVIDLRIESPTFCQWFGIELSAANQMMLIVPEGFANGYQTLADKTEAFYFSTEFYAPEYERGIRWDDPLIKIKWPVSDPIVSLKDNSFPDYHTK